MSQPNLPKNPLRRRLFIVDHMCVLPYGHNQGSLVLFRQELSRHFDETIALVPRVLPARTAREKNFVRCLSYPYSALIETRFASLVNRIMRKKSVMRYYAKEGFRLAEKFFLVALKIIIRWDIPLWSAGRDWKKVLRRYAITENDTIFFPSADYYGAITLLGKLLKQPSSRPKIHMRMIGVTENAAICNITPRADLLRRVREAREAGVDIVLSAETPVYAAYLTQILGNGVFYFPYPLIGPLLSMPHAQPAVVASIGQGRKDKGYFQLAELVRFTGFQRRGELAFVIQSVPDDHPSFCKSYERVLGAIPNVRLLPPVLDDQEIADLYRHSAVILLPYDRKTYAMRGSAIYQEATALGRPVIGLSDVGFADLIERYENGYVCHDLKECAEAIYKCLAISPEEWDQRLKTARELFTADIEVAIQLFLGRRP